MIRLTRTAATLLLALLASCATPGEQAHKAGLEAFRGGSPEDGLVKLREATELEPRNAEMRGDYLNLREQLITRYLAEARNERIAGRPDEADAYYRRVLALDQENARARAGLATLEREKAHFALADEARGLLKKGDLNGARARVERVLAEDPDSTAAQQVKREIDAEVLRRELSTPQLKSRYRKPVTLEFRDAALKNIFEALSKASGINFVFDKDVKTDIKATVFLRQVSVEDAIDLILLPNQLDKKVLSENSVLVYPNNPAKQKEYQELVIKTFHLGNTDPKQTLNLIKTVLKTKDVYIDERVNLLVMRDTPEAIRLAERLINNQDLTDAEVMLEMEVLEVARGKATELGLKYPNQFTAVFDGDLLDLQNLKQGRITASTPNLTINLRKELTDSNLLASPRVRVKNREKAKVLIGDRLPVISAVVTPSTGTPVTTETVQYLDVGLKLEVEPTIHPDDEVGIKVNLEVSTANNRRTTQNGTTVYDIGTRSATTVLRLKDGETQVLMGLIRNDDNATDTRVPGLGDIPGLGRLFSNVLKDRKKTEVILSITPRIVRNIKRPDVQESEFWSGTEAALRTRPITVEVLPESAGVATTVNVAGASAAAASAIPSPAPPGAAPLGPVQLVWEGPAEVKVGGQFTLGLKASSKSPLQSAVVQLRFDPESLEVVKVDEGPYFNKGGAATSFTQRVEAATGRVFAGIALSAGGEGVAGEGQLISITFKAKAAAPKSQVHILAVQPVGPGNRALPIRASGPFDLALSP